MWTVSTTTVSDVAVAFDAVLAAARRARARAGILPGDLTLAQAHLLDPLRAGQARGAGELAEAAGVARPSATRMLDALERDGIVTRERSGQDRRCVRVALTRAGRDRVEQASAARVAWREAVFAGLSPAERAETARVLTRLSALIEEHSS